VTDGPDPPDGPFADWMARGAALIDAGLSEILAAGPEPSPALWAAMAYTALGGGKRLRGLLALASAEAAGAGAAAALPAALAVELIHAYSLIHDDLPALDDDDLRRGRPTNHLVHGEAMAILAGDALQTLAFEVLATPEARGGPDNGGGPEGPERPERAAARLRAVRILASAAGPKGMAAGQALDLALENATPPLETVLAMESLKTGRLVSAAMAMGAALGGGAPALVELLAGAGLQAGLAFQIKDDLLNHEGDPAVMGKSAGTDASRGKASAVAAMGPEGAAAEAARLAGSALGAVGPLGAPNLGRLLAMIVHRDR
jgi:farnesyl diphosphate synthase